MTRGRPGEASAIKRVELTHACGFKTDWPAGMAKHAMHCDGKPVPTRGRIDRLAHRAAADRTPPAAKRPRTKRSSPVRHRKRALAIVEAPTPVLAIPVGPSARLTFLEQLRVARGRIDAAIEAVEGLG